MQHRGSVYAIEEDHVNPELIFCGTEFGVFFSPNGGAEWKQLKSGVPTIAVRDLAIQRRENDLVLGTFGRGFYVLDDYSSLRQLSNSVSPEEPILFDVRDAFVYSPSRPLGLDGKSFQGDSYYSGEDLGPVAIIDYFLIDGFTSKKDARKKNEKKDAKSNRDNRYPSYEELLAESEESELQLVFIIKDEGGSVVRKLYKKPSKGYQRLKWDLRYPSKSAINLNKSSFYNPFAGKPTGTMVAPGIYTVAMHMIEDGKMKLLSKPVDFKVKSLGNQVMPATDLAEKIEFQKEVTQLARRMEGAGKVLSEVETKMKHIVEAIKMVEDPAIELTESYYSLDKKIKDVRRTLYGDRIKSRLDIEEPPTPYRRIMSINYEQKNTTSAPTGTHKMSFGIAKEEFEPILQSIRNIALIDLAELETELENINAPYTPGRAIKMIE